MTAHRNIYKYIPFHLVYLFKVYLLGLLGFTFFRLIQFFAEFARIADIPASERVGIFLHAFFMGFRFDTVISGYILLLPFLVLSVAYALYIRRVLIYRIVHIYLLIFYGLCFLIYAIDIPFFHQFFSRLTTAAFLWMDSPGFMVKMILQEPRYFWTVIPFILIIMGFWYILRKLNRSTLMVHLSVANSEKKISTWVRYGIFSLFFLLLLFIGARGRLAQKSPIRVGTAYFSTYAYPNQLGLNPVFTLIRSMLNASKEESRFVQLMDDDISLDLTREYLDIPLQDSLDSPIARWIVPENSSLNRPNIVLVLMESMSTVKMGRYGNPGNFTPHLDSLAAEGWVFDSIFTAGIHTFNGVYSTLFSFPALFEQHPLKEVDMLYYHGLPGTLREFGYQSIYFTTHDDQFDNIAGFLSNNGIDHIVSQKDYPREEVLSNLGVPDDYLFRFSLPILDELTTNDQPFLAIYMTASDHGPYVIPEYFRPHSERVTEQSIEYADWSIGQFMQQCSEKSWFDNTLFVFIADHGAALETTYDMPLYYHHTPLIFYGKNILDGQKSFMKLGGQIDVFPTLMGILRYPYINNTLGVDLVQHDRPYIYFSADNKYGIMNDHYFLVVRQSGEKSLYNHPVRDLANYEDSLPKLANEMQQYADAQMQTAQWMILHRKTGKPRNIK